MKRAVRSLFPGGIYDDKNDNEVSSSSTVVMIMTFINQYTRKIYHCTNLSLPTFCWKNRILFLSLWHYYYYRNSIQGASSWYMGCWEHFIPDSWLDFMRDCFSTMMCWGFLELFPTRITLIGLVHKWTQILFIISNYKLVMWICSQPKLHVNSQSKFYCVLTLYHTSHCPELHILLSPYNLQDTCLEHIIYLVPS